VRPLRLAPAAAAVCAATVLLTGCTGGGTGSGTGTAHPAGATSTPARDNGIAGLSATELLTRANRALAGARTVRVTADVRFEGQRIQIDERIRSDQGATGTLRLDGAAMEFLRLGRTFYVRADAANWRKQGVPRDAVAVLVGKWVRLPSTGPDFADFAKLSTIRELARLFIPTDELKGVQGPWPRSTLRGQPVVRMGEDRLGALYVAAVGAPYPVRAVTAGGAESGRIDFLAYNQPVTLTQPPPAQVLTLPSS
jgi:hypothetical protein